MPSPASSLASFCRARRPEPVRESRILPRSPAPKRPEHYQTLIRRKQCGQVPPRILSPSHVSWFGAVTGWGQNDEKERTAGAWRFVAGMTTLAGRGGVGRPRFLDI